MQNELQRVTGNLEKVNSEWKPLRTGEGALFEAVKERKLIHVSGKELVECLRYCFVLVGLRETSFPTEEETGVLSFFIRQKYSGHSLAEFRIAFEMAAANELEGDMRHFEKFSPEYFGRVMSAYRKWSAEKLKDTPITQPLGPQLAELPSGPVDWSPEWLQVVEWAKKRQIRNKILPPIYEWLIETGKLELSNDDKIELFNEARTAYMAELQEQQSEGKATFADIQVLRELKSRKLVKGDPIHTRIANKAKELAIIQLAISEAINDEL